jgi:hypothetical protein
MKIVTEPLKTYDYGKGNRMWNGLSAAYECFRLRWIHVHMMIKSCKSAKFTAGFQPLCP